MKITSSKPKGQRIFKTRSFSYYSIYRKRKKPFWIQTVEADIYFDAVKNEWIKNPETIAGLHDVYHCVRHYGLKEFYSLKAVVRFIKKCKAPKGIKFIASLPFNGYDFFITK